MDLKGMGIVHNRDINLSCQHHPGGQGDVRGEGLMKLVKRKKDLKIRFRDGKVIVPMPPDEWRDFMVHNPEADAAFGRTARKFLEKGEVRQSKNPSQKLRRSFNES